MLDDHLTVSAIVGQFSDQKRAEVESGLLAKAVSAARRDAEVLAKEARLRIVGIRTVNAAPGYRPSFEGDGMMEQVRVMSVNRAFSVASDLVGKVKVSVDLVLEIETTPTN